MTLQSNKPKEKKCMNAMDKKNLYINKNHLKIVAHLSKFLD
jgi:hypothetical protein